MKFLTNTVIAAGIFGQTVSATYLFFPDSVFGDIAGDSITCTEHYCNDPRSYSVCSAWGEYTFEQCCKRHFSPAWKIDRCLKNGEHGYSGTYKWYVDETSGKCLQDCESVGGLCTNPGTIVYPSEGVVLYDTPSICCDSGLGHVAKDYCVAESQEVEYEGSYRYYVEDMTATRLIGSFRSIEYPTGTRCVQDCIDMDGPSGPCSLPGGIVKDSSIALYDDTEKCCDAELHHIDRELCQSNSNFWSLGSKKWYPDHIAGQCVHDRDGCPVLTHEGVMCVNVPDVGTKLYETIEDCCDIGLASIDKDLCVAKTSGEPSGGWTSSGVSEGGRRRATEASKCIKDCTEPELTSNAGGPEPYCATITNMHAKLYESADACCTWALPWVDHDLCKSNSLGVPSEKWFLSNPTDTVCSKDCGTAELTSNSGSSELYCADIPESGVALFDSAEACCSGALWWISADSCASRTMGGYTNLWYAGNDGSKCFKDCDATAAGAPEECAGNPEDTTAALYQDYASCCANKFWWDRESCLVQTTGEAIVGSAKYYVDWVLGKCVQDCAGDAPCGGFAPSWITVKHDSVDACCSTHLRWVAKEICTAA